MVNCDRDSIPQHVAIVMDGNGRWAKQRGLPRLAGHWKGEVNARRVVEILLGYAIQYVTLYVFSTENWSRPDYEVKGIFQVLLGRIDAELEFAQRRGIKLCHLGKLDGLPAKVRRKIEHVVEMTRDNEAMTVSLAINYGGRDEIIKAVQCLMRDGIPAENVNESLFSQYLYTNGIPDPDLIIRTGGEIRLSNFLLWQAAYSEFYSTQVLWPDFNRDEIDKALIAYKERQRRFGSVIPSE